jgi:carboxymethylenebutenolidase
VSGTALVIYVELDPSTSENGMIIKDTESVDVYTSTGPMRTYLFRPATEGRYPGLLLFSEIFQVTAPILGG